MSGKILCTLQYNVQLKEISTVVLNISNQFYFKLNNLIKEKLVVNDLEFKAKSSRVFPPITCFEKNNRGK